MVKKFCFTFSFILLFAGISGASLKHHWPLDETTLDYDGTWIGAKELITGIEGKMFGYASESDVTQSGIKLLGNPGPQGGSDYAYDLETDGGIGGVATQVYGALPATSDFTAVIWFKTSLPHASQGHIFSNNSGQAGRCNLFIHNSMLGLWADGFSSTLSSEEAVDDGNWHEATFSRKGSTFYLFLDGTLQDTGDFPGVSIDQSTFWMMGRQRSWGGDYEGMVSDVKVYDTNYTQVSTGAWNPAPAAEQIEVGTPNNGGLDVQLSWQTARDPENPDAVNPDVNVHYLYLSDNQNTSSDPNLYLFDTIPVTGDKDTLQTKTLSLDYDGHYYWKVEEGLDDGAGGTYPAGSENNIDGLKWRFETLASVPLLTDPSDQMVDPGETAAFSVEIDSLGPVNQWNWYKQGDPDTLVDDSDSDITITNTQTSSTLEIADADEADGGFYYFEAVNDGGQSEPTTAAELRVKALIGHWKLDGTAADSSGNGNNGTVQAVEGGSNPQWVDGFDGQAFYPDEQYYVQIPHDSIFNVLDSLTVSVWVKGGIMNPNCPFVAKHEFISGWMLNRTGSAGNARFIARDAANYHRYGPFAIGSTDLQDEQWHQVVGVLDSANGHYRIYVDGVLEDTQPYDHTQMVFNDAPILIGASQFNDAINGFALNAALDDVKIYNYAKDPVEVAQDYTSMAGGEICVERPALDISGEAGEPDCVVDMWDLLELSENWLDCALVPECYLY
ncbi:LamG-like jellyroll fold domain-containing protein [Sedimentisphaera salicampi]|uniref:Laminin G domain protein n=1 Tax=Sedimentisphaera salicampi TaxID=1941349 RepID=A0A1W6LMU5_9BACT|nr:LamG-like jellyroll fold domain-containing protein [Sedimentisphaera salicampi]ARN57097.1 Laminin G domain protein [Sedimentisphaera salicampi]